MANPQLVYRTTTLRAGPGDGAFIATEGLDSAVLSPAGTYLWSYPIRRTADAHAEGD